MLLNHLNPQLIVHCCSLFVGKHITELLNINYLVTTVKLIEMVCIHDVTEMQRKSWPADRLWEVMMLNV